MENHSINQTRMLRTSNETLNDFKSKWTGFKPMENLSGELNIVIGEIDKNLDIIAGIDTGPSKNKEILRQLMIQSAMKISGSAYVYAVDNKNTLLSSKMDIVKSDFSHLSDAEQANKAEMIFDELNPIVVSLVDYRILPADLTKLETRVVDYRNSLTAPKISINVSSEAKVEIKSQIKIGLVVLDKIDRLMEQYREDEHKFFDLYFKSRIILDLGHRYNKPISYITGKIVDFETEAIIIDAKIHFEGEEKLMVRSNDKGDFKIGAHKAGEMVLVAEKEGFKKCEEMLFIVKDEDQEMNLDMEVEEAPVTPEI